MTILALTADTAIQLGLSMAAPGEDVTVVTSVDGLRDLPADGFVVAVIDLGGTPAGLRAAWEVHSTRLASRIVVVGDVDAEDAPPATTVLLRPLELSALRDVLLAALAEPPAPPGTAAPVHAVEGAPVDDGASPPGALRPSPNGQTHHLSDSRAALDELLTSTALRVAEYRQRDAQPSERERPDPLDLPRLDDPPVAGEDAAEVTTVAGVSEGFDVGVSEGFDVGVSGPLDAGFAEPLDAGFSEPLDAGVAEPLDVGLSEALDGGTAADGAVAPVAPARDGHRRTPARLARWRRGRRAVAVAPPPVGVELGAGSPTPVVSASDLDAAIAHLQQLEDLLARVPGVGDPGRVAAAVVDEIRETHHPEIAVLWELRDESFVVASGHGLTPNQLRSTVPLTQPLLAHLVASPGCHLVEPATQDVTAFVGLPTVATGQMVLATVPAEAPVEWIVLVAGAHVGEELRRWLPGLLAEAAPHLRLARRLCRLARHVGAVDR